MATLYDPAGQAWEPSSPVEETRLLAAGYTRTKPFDPAEHPAAEVVAHLQEHPADAPQVVAAERAGKNRKTVTGDQEE